ncbi:hypothetical protein BC937DRAFT_89475 [Endogone sp. FLAS-F59071]|nr:hypothetical protein BC937DRAFT_89475 [Endogone sp. FLAS-F59071]|eukprot:RUS17808.1 hypothetical protein BC937DRAFT_89475 [Endogone sp. FLAS-F59071]
MPCHISIPLAHLVLSALPLSLQRNSRAATESNSLSSTQTVTVQKQHSMIDFPDDDDVIKPIFFDALHLRDKLFWGTIESTETTTKRECDLVTFKIARHRPVNPVNPVNPVILASDYLRWRGMQWENKMARWQWCRIVCCPVIPGNPCRSHFHFHFVRRRVPLELPWWNVDHIQRNMGLATIFSESLHSFKGDDSFSLSIRSSDLDPKTSRSPELGPNFFESSDISESHDLSKSFDFGPSPLEWLSSPSLGEPWMMLLKDEFIQPYRLISEAAPFGVNGKILTIPNYQPLPIITVWDAVGVLWTHYISWVPETVKRAGQEVYLHKMLELLAVKVAAMEPNVDLRPSTYNVTYIARKNIKRFLFGMSIRCDENIKEEAAEGRMGISNPNRKSAGMPGGNCAESLPWEALTRRRTTQRRRIHLFSHTIEGNTTTKPPCVQCVRVAASLAGVARIFIYDSDKGEVINVAHYPK